MWIQFSCEIFECDYIREHFKTTKHGESYEIDFCKLPNLKEPFTTAIYDTGEEADRQFTKIAKAIEAGLNFVNINPEDWNETE